MNSIKLSRAQIPKAREIIQAQQGNQCAVCGISFAVMTIKGRKRVPKALPCLDHDHTTGFVRGVLCTTCNGKFGEGKVKQAAVACARASSPIVWLRAMLAYWEKHEQPQTQYIHPEHKTEDEKRLAKNAKERKKRATAKARAILSNRK
tara:strand:+ start:556 stop:999 length:444 start_codon:yes stop_codon:yes gene_type:complete